MTNLTITCYHERFNYIFLKVDDKHIKFKNQPNLSRASLTLTPGEHEITIAKWSFLYKWYWWLNILNLFYVCSLLKNRTDGFLGYDENFASNTLKIFVIDNETSVIETKLLQNEYTNKKGHISEYLSWKVVSKKKVKIIEVLQNEMPPKLIKRWRIAYGLPTSFYCIMAYITFIKEKIEFDCLTVIIMLAFTAYSIYIAITYFKRKSVDETIEKAEKIQYGNYH